VTTLSIRRASVLIFFFCSLMYSSACHPVSKPPFFIASGGQTRLLRGTNVDAGGYLIVVIDDDPRSVRAFPNS
jgi:hypothetical protein